MADLFKNVKDVNVQPLYDTLVIPAAGATLLNFFAAPVGQGVSVYQTAGGALAKTLRDTNLTLAGQLSDGFYFKILGFRIAPSFDMTDADAHVALNGAVFTFAKQAKVFIQVPAATIPQGNGPFGSGASMNSNGYPALQNSYSIGKHPIDIGPSENFNVSLTWAQARAVTTADAAAGGHQTGLPITIYLDGFYFRPVQ